MTEFPILGELTIKMSHSMRENIITYYIDLIIFTVNHSAGSL